MLPESYIVKSEWIYFFPRRKFLRAAKPFDFRTNSSISLSKRGGGKGGLPPSIITNFENFT